MIKRNTLNVGKGAGNLLVLVLLSGCASYHAQPVCGTLVPPDLSVIRVQANSFSHPLLKPVVFDDRDGLSSDEAAILAVLANPELRVVRHRRGIADAQLLQAGLLPNPQLSAGFNVPLGGNTDSTVTGYGLGLDWEVTALLARNARQEAAKAHAGSADLEIAWQEWQVAEAARLHYGRLRFADRKLALAQQMEQSAEQLHRHTQRSVDLGLQTQSELSSAEVALQEARTGLVDARSTVERERQAFNHILGLPPQTMVPLAAGDGFPFPDDVRIEALFDAAVTNRLDLRALRLGYESQEARVRAAVRSAFPKITLGLTGGRDTDNVQTIGAGLGIELPFFDHNQGAIAKERASRKALADEYHARLFETRTDLARLAVSIAATKQKLAGIDPLLSELEAQADRLRRAEEDGQTDVFAVHAAEEALLGKKLQRLEQEQKLMEAGLALELASGCHGLEVEP